MLVQSVMQTYYTTTNGNRKICIFYDYVIEIVRDYAPVRSHSVQPSVSSFKPFVLFYSTDM